MDSITHIALGACIGDLFLGKKIGKIALFYGAVAASLPDIDFLASLWLNTTEDLLAHRGFTHSILFAGMVIAAMAIFLRKRHRMDNLPVKTWLLFLTTAMGSHLFLDAFNAYGIGWFEPFSHRRISFHTVFVADPFFSIWPGIAAAFLVFINRYYPKRSVWAGSGLLICSLYLLYCVYNKFNIDQDVRYNLIRQNIRYTRYFSTPTPFNNWLWYVVAETDSGYYLGYRSVFDRKNLIDFTFFPKKEELLKPFYQRNDLQLLIRFSQGYFTTDSSANGVVFNDLRFGQVMGWQDPDAGFIFHFYLQKPDDNHLVVQRSRFANWNRQTAARFIRRIRGN